MVTFILQFVASFFSTVAFGVITNIPRKTMFSAGIAGAIGWVIYYYGRVYFHSEAFGNFLGASAIGLLCIYFSRRLKYPTLIFQIPALVPLVPGGPSYQMVRNLVLGNDAATFNYLVKVIVTAGSIAAGFMATSLIEKKMMSSLKLRYQRYTDDNHSSKEE